MVLRRVVRCAGVAAFVVGLTLGPSVFTPGRAFADSASDFCSMNNDFGLTHGACVSTFQSQGQSSAFASSECKVLADLFGGYPFTLIGTNGAVVVNNHGQCVKFFNQSKP